MKVTLTEFESKRVEEYSRGLVSDTSAESTTMVEGTFEEVRGFLSVGPAIRVGFPVADSEWL